MGGRGLVLFAVLFSFSLTIWANPVHAAEYNCTNCSDCSSKIQSASSGDIIRLNTTITGQDGTCIDFNGTDNVTFDCDGFTIGGDGDDTGYGINVSYDANNNTIRDCTNISYFGKGIWIKDSNYNRIEYCTVIYNDENQGPSCPFVYSWTGSGYVFDNEGLTKHHFSMFNGSEYTRLPSLQPNGSEFKVKITEELPEDTYLNYVALYRVVHDSDIEIYSGWFNQLYALEYPQEPTSATDDAGNDVSYLLQKDGTYWNSNDFSGTNYTDDDGDGLADLANVDDLGKYLELTFEKPAGVDLANLLLRPKQLPLKNYMGSRVKALLMEHDLFDLSLTSNFAKQQIKFGDDIFNGFVQENAFVENALIDIYVWNGTDWLLKSVIYEKPADKGPDVVYPLNISDIDTEDLKIRFYTFPDLMGLDYVFVDYSDNDDVVIEEIPITSAFKDGESVLTNLSDIDDNLLLIESGEEVELTFTDGSSPAGTVTYFIELNGYYRGYDRENELNYTKQEVLSFFQIPFWNPRFFVPRYLDGGWGHSGIHLRNSKHSIITDVETSHNDADGIYVEYSNNNTLINITAFNNTNYGVYLYDVDNSVLTDITASSNSRGLVIDGSLSYQSNNNTITNVISTYNSAMGFYVSKSNNSTFTNMTLSDNQDDGLNIGTANNNTFTNITISNNQNEGIYIYDSDTNTFRNATINTLNQTGLLLSGSSQSHFVHDIDISNTINGKPIQYFDGYHKTCPDNQILGYNNTYSQVTFVGCNNVTLNNATLIDSLYFLFSNNSRIYNIKSSHNYYGILLINSYNNNLTNITANNNLLVGVNLRSSSKTSSNITLTDITANDNQAGGISVFKCDNTILTNIISTDNVYDGVSVSSSDNNTLTNITAMNNTMYGIRISTSYNNTLTNITSLVNQQDGLRIQTSENNILTNIVSSNNIQCGIEISKSNYNTINNSRIENNIQCGIYLEGIGSDYSRYNIFHNNLFNNTINLYSNHDSNLNYWNTTLNCSAGPNIMGESCIGGNFWTDSDGNFSNTCTDANSDGICDSSYTPFTNNTDHLPLQGCVESWSCSPWSECIGDVQTRTCTDSNSCSTILLRPSLSQSCVTPTLGGGSSEEEERPPEVKHSWTQMTPEENVTMPIDKEGLDFSEIKISVRNQINQVSITVTRLDSKPPSVQKEVTGRAYQYIEIKKNNIENENIEQVKLKFKVAKSWLNENNFNRATVRLERYENDEWEKLPTVILDEDDEYVYFEAESPGFSYFAITAEETVEAEPEETEEPKETEPQSQTESPEVTPDTEQPADMSAVIIGIIVIVIVAVFIGCLGKLKPKKKKKRSIFKRKKK